MSRYEACTWVGAAHHVPTRAQGGDMDVLDLLTKEHDEAKAVFKRIESSKSDAERKRLWTQLSADLSLHEEMEETLFYPPLKEVAKVEDIVLEGYQEHHVM